jgi:hypothetical protein
MHLISGRFSSAVSKSYTLVQSLTIKLVMPLMVEKAGTLIKDMDDRPSPDRVPPVVWKLIRLKTLQYQNYNMCVPKWSYASDNQIQFDIVTTPSPTTIPSSLCKDTHFVVHR